MARKRKNKQNAQPIQHDHDEPESNTIQTPDNDDAQNDGGDPAQHIHAQYREQRARGRSAKQIRAVAFARNDDGMVAYCDEVIAGERPDWSSDESTDSADEDMESEADAATPESPPDATHDNDLGDDGPGDDGFGLEGDEESQEIEGSGDPEGDDDWRAPVDIDKDNAPASDDAAPAEPAEPEAEDHELWRGAKKDALGHYFTLRAQGFSTARIERAAERDNDDEVVAICRRMALVEGGPDQPVLTPEELGGLDARLLELQQRTTALMAEADLLRERLWHCKRMRREVGRPPRAARRSVGDGVCSGRVSLKTAAAEWLARTGESLNCKAIVKALEDAGIWSSPGGRTPDATLHAGIATEIKEQGDKARFVKTKPGHFAASETFVAEYRAAHADTPDGDAAPADQPDDAHDDRDDINADVNTEDNDGDAESADNE